MVVGRGGRDPATRRAFNLNVDVHALVLDGVFAKGGSGVVGFHQGPRLTALDVAEVLATVEPRIKRLLVRRGLGGGDDEGSAPDAWADEAPVLAGQAAASVRSVRLVSASDKLHNARAILAGYRQLGESVWQRFNAPRGDILWYYRSLVSV